MNSIFPNLNPAIETIQGNENRYNRHERRTGKFVIINLTNNKFVQMSRTGDTIKFKDVPIKEASIWMFPTVQNAIGHLLMNEPNLNVDFRMVYSHNKRIMTK